MMDYNKFVDVSYLPSLEKNLTTLSASRSKNKIRSKKRNGVLTIEYEEGLAKIIHNELGLFKIDSFNDSKSSQSSSLRYPWVILFFSPNFYLKQSQRNLNF